MQAAMKGLDINNVKKTYLGTDGCYIGNAAHGFVLCVVLIPNKLAAGGISGLGIILYHLYQFPVSLSVFGQRSLFILAWITLGWKFVAHSRLSTILLP